MKRTFRAAAMLLFTLTFGCAQNAVAQTEYRITGSWNGGDGEKVYLRNAETDKTGPAVDSTTVKGGRFSLNGKIPVMGKMSLACKAGKHDVFIDGEPLTADIIAHPDTTGKGKKPHLELKITGGKEQKALDDGSSLSLMAAFLQLGQMMSLSKVMDEKDTVKLKHDVDSIQSAYKLLDTELEKGIKNYLDSARDCAASTYFIEDYISKYKPFDEFKQCYDNLTERVKATPRGKALKAAVDALASASVGGIAPDIKLPTPTGKTLSLHSLRGHIVLLDFWASWCGPCLAEMPNVKAIYAKYHKKGLEIFGVSLDEKADAWKRAIAKHGLSWNHVSSLKGWECPAAKTYNVTGIPRMYIIDRSGKIIAQDLRGKALADKMEELFNEK